MDARATRCLAPKRRAGLQRQRTPVATGRQARHRRRQTGSDCSTNIAAVAVRLYTDNAHALQLRGWARFAQTGKRKVEKKVSVASGSSWLPTTLAW